MNTFLLKQKLKGIGAARDKMHKKVFVENKMPGMIASAVASVYFLFTPIKSTMQTEVSGTPPQAGGAAYAKMDEKLKTMQSWKAVFEQASLGNDMKKAGEVAKYLEWEAYRFTIDLYTTSGLSEKKFNELGVAYKNNVNINPKFFDEHHYTYQYTFGRGGNYRDECLKTTGADLTDQHRHALAVASCMHERSSTTAQLSSIGSLAGSLGLGALGFGLAGGALRRRDKKDNKPKN